MSFSKIKTTSGLLEGQEKDGVEIFYGIPYAKKPVGKKRFKRSEFFKSTKILSCKEPKGSSYQFGPNFDGDKTPNESLDCLYLNVFRKNDGQEKKPVFIWIHGGGFLTGCSYYPMYDGSFYANQEIIFVSINYRLGCFGYLDLSPLGPDFDSNCGLSDQINALRWVKENIEAFGGDSKNITVGGESAGGISLWALLSSPKTVGLFQKVAFESSLPYCFLNEKLEASYRGAFLKALGLKKEEGEELLSINPHKLVQRLKMALEQVKAERIGAMTLAPLLDDLLPYDALEASKRGINQDVKILIGTNKDEGTIFANQFFKGEQPFGWELNEKMFKENKAEDIFPAIKEYYESQFGPVECFHQLAYDNLFVRGMLDNLEIRKKYTDCYVFRFDYSTPESRKIGFNACHALEMSFVLHTTSYTLNHLPLLKGADKGEVKNIEVQMSSAWLQFIRTSNPGFEAFNKNEKAHIFDLTPREISYENYKPLSLFKGKRINTA